MIGLLPWVASIDRFVFGVPFIYMWVFIWFVLTSGCMWLCWTLFDRHEPEAASDEHLEID